MQATSFIKSLRCLRCGAEYAPDTNAYVCQCRPNRGSDVGTLDVQYDYTALQQAITPAQIAADRDRSIGHYWPLLPIASRHDLPPLAVGNTPLTQAKRLGATLGFAQLYIKDDGRNPSASLKDRASAIAVARAQAEQFPIVATASTGNAAAALAGQCAAAGQRNVIFVPKTAPQAKIAQLLVYGSTVLALDGTYDQAFDLCQAVCHEFGWYNRNTGYNPYMTEGKKTVAFEIAEQLGGQGARGKGQGAGGRGQGAGGRERGARGRGQGAGNEANSALRTPHSAFVAPDAVFVSVGDGCIIGGVHKGFKDLLALGWIERMPRIYGVQSTKSAALYNAWRAGLDVPEPVQATTRADSISVDAPRDPVKALNAVRQTNGAFIIVPDEEILGAILPLARLGAVFAEPAGATAYAGFVQAAQQGLVQPHETIVVINTGNGLKDVNATIQVTGGTTVIEPTLAAVQKALKI
ncbi:MAG: pyridoxal-phosphate dependent enzyme [Caldilineaceae bacterium]